MIFDKIRDIIAEQLGAEKKNITLSTNLMKDLEADSLDAVEIVMAIEDEFDITIDDEVAQSFKTVGQIAEFIKSKE
jgi:acyl carrier protein